MNNKTFVKEFFTSQEEQEGQEKAQAEVSKNTDPLVTFAIICAVICGIIIFLIMFGLLINKIM